MMNISAYLLHLMPEHLPTALTPHFYFQMPTPYTRAFSNFRTSTGQLQSTHTPQHWFNGLEAILTSPWRTISYWWMLGRRVHALAVCSLVSQPAAMASSTPTVMQEASVKLSGPKIQQRNMNIEQGLVGKTGWAVSNMHCMHGWNRRKSI